MATAKYDSNAANNQDHRRLQARAKPGLNFFKINLIDNKFYYYLNSCTRARAYINLMKPQYQKLLFSAVYTLLLPVGLDLARASVPKSGRGQNRGALRAAFSFARPLLKSCSRL